MLPKAKFVFTIPSLHDDLKLEGRLYFPRELLDHKGIFIRGFAIFAHPYAPLGGNWDDPIVQTVGAFLIQQGFVLSTFNFRGANGSHRSTSWTGKAELGDYTSFYLLMLQLLNASEVVAYVNPTDEFAIKPVLILGGYSYGSLIASHLPTLDAMHKVVESAHPGSSAYEIRLRALEISKTLLGYLKSHLYQGQAALHDPDAVDFPSYRRGLALGGNESENTSRRISKESLRQSVDKFRHKLGSRRSSQQTSEVESVGMSTDISVRPKIAYLLISPLLPPISGITTMFSRLKFEHKSGTEPGRHYDSAIDYKENITRNSTCAIWGTKDGFTSSRKLHKWADELQLLPRSQFIIKVIEGIGHFWTEAGAKSELCSAIQDWLNTILRHESTQQSIA